MSHDDLVASALAVLLDPALEPIVELVVGRDGEGFAAHAVDGAVRFRREPDGTFTTLAVEGRDPLGDQATDRFAGLDVERAHRFPHRTVNAYPHAYEHVAQVFDHPGAPDLVVLHTAAHHWADRGGHLGEHGSLGVVQARAPFIAAGRGVRALGRVPRSARLVDLAPTLCELLGARPPAGADGAVVEGLLDPGERPDHVVAFLLDGTNPNVLYDLIDRGELPNLARLAAMGTTFGHGMMASLPTVTLANHTTALTGRHPGHHGILHNAWYDRGAGRQIVTNDASVWASAMVHLAPGVETVHDAVHASVPGAFTASVNEPADRGADVSTFGFMRAGVRIGFPRTAEGLPHTTERFVRPFKDYETFTRVDHHGMCQAVALFSGEPLGGSVWPLPRFCWVNFALTDSAFHAGGPHSEVAEAGLRDTDARIGEVLAAVERAGVFGRTAFTVVADHGMEQTDPAVTGDWDAALTDAGLPFRDEAYGFLYLGVT